MRAADINRVVATARAAFNEGRGAGQTPAARTEVLLRLAAPIRAHVPELELLDSLDRGPLIRNAQADDPLDCASAMEAMVDVASVDSQMR